MYTCIVYACSNCLLLSCELNNRKKSNPPYTVQKMQARQSPIHYKIRENRKQNDLFANFN